MVIHFFWLTAKNIAFATKLVIVIINEVKASVVHRSNGVIGSPVFLTLYIRICLCLCLSIYLLVLIVSSN